VSALNTAWLAQLHCDGSSRDSILHSCAESNTNAFALMMTCCVICLLLLVCLQSALEAAAEDAMAAAVKRMNRAVEMVADAESRAAAAAAMATAYQDISDGQAEAARAAADLPVMPARQAQAAGHIANLQKVLHEQMFSVSSLIGDWVAGVWAAIVGAVAWVQASVAGAWGGLVGAVSGAGK
jgi:hypothetical protein